MRAKWILALGLIFVITSALLFTASARAQTGTLGDPLRGGLLYDSWFAVLGVDAPDGNHPLWSTQDTNSREGAQTWRCIECHGWDYQGADGVYGSGPHYTGFPGVMAAMEQPDIRLLRWLRGRENPAHDFSAYLSEKDLLDVIAFLRTSLVDYHAIINYETAASRGRDINGESLYNGVCALCHGEDGGQLNFGTAHQPEFVADIAVEDPWRFVHKVRFGHPDSDMPSGDAIGWSLAQVGDVLAYAQTLPQAEYVPPTPTATPAVVDLENQGDTEAITWGAAAIVLVILIGAVWAFYRT
jgi:mono/diheme cytochrome c family protein